MMNQLIAGLNRVDKQDKENGDAGTQVANIVREPTGGLPVMIEPHMRLIEIAVSSGADVEKIEKLMVLQERWEANNAKKAFNAAMSKFQSMLPIIEKQGVVDYEPKNGGARVYYQYARLEDIAQAIQPALKETGLSYRFKQSQQDGKITVSCIVTHKDGHSDSTEMVSTPDTSGGKEALKALASAASHLRRYTLTGILGVVVGGEDDENTTPSSEPEKSTACYPDEEFNKNLSRWSWMILDGKKTVDQLHEFLTKKNIILSQDQYAKLQQVGK